MEHNKDGRKSITVDGVYDIETSKWTEFVCGAVLDRTGFYSYTWRREDDFVDSLLERSGRYYAHNGGKYDGLWFLSHVRRRGLKAICSGAGQRLTSIKVGSLILADSYAIVPMPLKDGAKLGRYQKCPTGFPCNCEAKTEEQPEGCGGYCYISRHMSPSDMRKLLSYLEQDCKATLSMLDCLLDFAAENDLDIKNTIGGSSWATAQRWLGIPKADWSWGSRGQSISSLYKLARSAYFGGRVQVFRPEAEAGWQYDVNSAYPAALATLELPSGIPSEVYNSDARRAWRADRAGLYRARVRIPECHIPPLPVRGKLRLRYPYGDVEGVWSANELQYAEEMGGVISRIDAGLVWSSREVLFAPLCRHVWALRDKVGTKSPQGSWLKWFINSLTGRLAIRPEGETIVVGGSTNAIRFCPQDWDCQKGRLHGRGNRGCCEHHCTRRCGATLPLGNWGQSTGVFVRHRWQIADSAHVHYAAYLTAHARIQLHIQLVDDEASGYSAVYCDTDSVYSITERINNIGKNLGQFKEEGPFAGDGHTGPGFFAMAPKTYDRHYWHPPYDIGMAPRDVHSKGVENTPENFDLLRAGESVIMDRGVMSLKSALLKSKREGRDDEFFSRKFISRRVLGTEDINGVRWYGDRFLGPDGVTHPERDILNGK